MLNDLTTGLSVAKNLSQQSDNNVQGQGTTDG